jgi:acyl dehydratase
VSSAPQTPTHGPAPLSSPEAAPVPLLERWFEDYAAGESFELGDEPITEKEIVEFAKRYDPQPFHIDPVAAAATHFGGLIASGWMTAAVSMRVMCQHFISARASMGSPGIDELRWLLPVRPGDRLRVRVEVLGCVPSKSKSDRGVVSMRQEVLMSLKTMALLKRRPAP